MKKFFLTLALYVFLGFLITNYVLQYMEYVSFRRAFLWNSALLCGLCFLLFLKYPVKFPPRRIFDHWGQGVLFVVIFAVGIIARTALWDAYPPPNGDESEEFQIAADAYRSIKQSRLDPYFPLMNLVGEVGFRILGVSMNALRIPFVCLGILSIGLFFIAARFFFHTFFAAIFSTALFASCTFLAGSSRVAMETMAPVATVSLSLACYFALCHRREVPYFALAGLTTGLLFLEYFSYKLAGVLLFLMLPLFLHFPACRKTENKDSKRRCPDSTQTDYAIAGGTRRPRESTRPGHFSLLRHYLPHLLVFSFFALAMTLPTNLVKKPSGSSHYFLEGLQRHLDRFYLDQEVESIARNDLVRQQFFNVKRTASYLFTGNSPTAEILPKYLGLIEFYTGLLGAVSLVYCLIFSWRNPGKLLVVSVVVLTVILAGILVINPLRYRLVPLIPFYFLAIGILVDDVFLRTRRRKITGRVFCVVFVALLLFLMAVNLYEFFFVTIGDTEVQTFFYAFDLIIAQEISAIQKMHPDTLVYLMTDREYMGVNNDYLFLYDYNRVKLIKSPNEIPGNETGYLITHDSFIPDTDDFANLVDCKRWHTCLDKNEVFVCRIKPPDFFRTLPGSYGFLSIKEMAIAVVQDIFQPGCMEAGILNSFMEQSNWVLNQHQYRIE